MQRKRGVTWQEYRKKCSNPLPRISSYIPPFQIPHYEPVNEKAAYFHLSQHKIRILLGGNQSGKSKTTTAEVIVICRNNHGTIAWACSGSFKMIGEALYPHYRDLLAHEEIDAVIWLNFGQRIPAIIRLKNGSEIHFKSYDQGVYKFQSARVNIIQLDEQPSFDIYQECLARTAATGGRIVFSMTPLAGSSYVETLLWNKRGVSPYIWGERMSYLENRFIDNETKQMLLSLYSQDEIARRVYGEFQRLQGSVFKEFDPQIHVIDAFDIPVAWRKIRTIDLGYNHAFVCLWIAQGDDDTLYIYNEHYQREMLVRDHAEIIRRKDYEWIGAYSGRLTNDDIIEATVCDHEAQTRAELDAAGIGTIPADKQDKALNIQRLNRRLKLRGNGKSGLYIFRHCTNTIREWQSWVYGKNEEPVKIDDHTCDAGLYGNAYFEPHEDGEFAGAGERVFVQDSTEDTNISFF